MQRRTRGWTARRRRARRRQRGNGRRDTRAVGEQAGRQDARPRGRRDVLCVGVGLSSGPLVGRSGAVEVTEVEWSVRYPGASRGPSARRPGRDIRPRAHASRPGLRVFRPTLALAALSTREVFSAHSQPPRPPRFGGPPTRGPRSRGHRHNHLRFGWWRWYLCLHHWGTAATTSGSAAGRGTVASFTGAPPPPPPARLLAVVPLPSPPPPPPPPAPLPPALPPSLPSPSPPPPCLARAMCDPVVVFVRNVTYSRLLEELRRPTVQAGRMSR